MACLMEYVDFGSEIHMHLGTCLRKDTSEYGLEHARTSGHTYVLLID